MEIKTPTASCSASSFGADGSLPANLVAYRPSCFKKTTVQIKKKKGNQNRTYVAPKNRFYLQSIFSAASCFAEIFVFPVPTVRLSNAWT